MVERGEKIPSLETFLTILNALEVSADMVLADVVSTGYIVKNSMLNEKLSKLSVEDRDKIYEVIDILIKHANKLHNSYTKFAVKGELFLLLNKITIGYLEQLILGVS